MSSKRNRSEAQGPNENASLVPHVSRKLEQSPQSPSRQNVMMHNIGTGASNLRVFFPDSKRSELRDRADAVASDSDDVDSVTGEPSVLQAYMEFASAVSIDPTSALQVAAQYVGAPIDSVPPSSWSRCEPDQDPATTSLQSATASTDSAGQEQHAVSRHAAAAGAGDDRLTVTRGSRHALTALESALEVPSGVDRYNRGFFVKHAAASGMDPLGMLQRVMKLLLSSQNARTAGRVGCGDLPLRLLEPVSPELQRLLHLHACAVVQAMQPPVGLGRKTGINSPGVLPSALQAKLTASEASLLGLESLKNSPVPSLTPSSASFDGVHLTMAGLCATLISFEHGLDFVAAPEGFPVLRSCRTRLQTQPSRMSSSSAHSNQGTVGGMSVSSRAVNEDVDEELGEGGSEGGWGGQHSSSNTVSLSVIFSRFPHLPLLLNEATDEDCEAARVFMRLLREGGSTAAGAEGSGPMGGDSDGSTASGDEAGSNNSAEAFGPGFSFAKDLPSVGVRGLMRKHLHAVAQPVLQVVFRPPFTVLQGGSKHVTTSGVPFECFANHALCRVLGIQAQDVADDMAGEMAARPRILMCFDGHPKTRMARTLATLAATASGQDSYQFEGMFLRFSRVGGVPGAEEGPLLASSMYGVETRHTERYVGGRTLCVTSYLSDLVMARDTGALEAMDLPGGELRTMEELLLNGGKYPDVQRAMRAMGTGDAATALWRTFDFSCRQLTMRALGLVQEGGCSASGPPFRSVDATVGRLLTHMLSAHLQRGGSFPPSSADVAKLFGDPQLEAILAEAVAAARMPSGGAGWSPAPASAEHNTKARAPQRVESEALFNFGQMSSAVHGSKGVKPPPDSTRKATAWDSKLRYSDSDVARVRDQLTATMGKGLLHELAKEALSQMSIMMGSCSMPDLLRGEAATPPLPSPVPPHATAPQDDLGFSVKVHVGDELVVMRRSMKGGHVMQQLLALAAMAGSRGVGGANGAEGEELAGPTGK